jgi:hypothetical protein
MRGYLISLVGANRNTQLKAILAKSDDGNQGWRPDIVCYRPIDGMEAVSTVLEIKLIRNDEDSKPCLGALKIQMRNARTIFPDADVLGVIYLAAAPALTPGSFEKAIETLDHNVLSSLPNDEGFTRVTGQQSVAIFAQVRQSLYIVRWASRWL